MQTNQPPFDAVTLRTSGAGVTRTEVLVVVLCVLVLFVIAAIVFSGGSQRTFVARRLKDATQLRLIHESWLTYAREFDGVMPTPSLIARSSREGIETTARGPEDISLNTTANVYSACIMQNYFAPDMSVVSPVETNPVVKAMRDDDYDYSTYLPAKSVYWDDTFTADLQTGSNVSYAHMPVYGRLRVAHWRESLGDAGWPLVGNRGPLNGANEPQSFTFKFYQPFDQWKGNICFADGHVEHLQGLPTSTTTDGRIINTQGLFRYDGEGDSDGILTFTRAMTMDGPVIQHD